MYIKQQAFGSLQMISSDELCHVFVSRSYVRAIHAMLDVSYPVSRLVATVESNSFLSLQCIVVVRSGCRFHIVHINNFQINLIYLMFFNLYSHFKATKWDEDDFVLWFWLSVARVCVRATEPPISVGFHCFHFSDPMSLSLLLNWSLYFCATHTQKTNASVFSKFENKRDNLLLIPIRIVCMCTFSDDENN